MISRSAYAALLGLTVSTSIAAAEPYCAAMLEANALESRYQRLAPVYNSAETGWIFASDQFDYRYVLSATEEELLADLVAELAARGTELAMLIAPPRPVLAGEAVLAATAGQGQTHDLDAQAAAFHRMMAQIVEAGVVAPNLLSLAEADPAIAGQFYFQRDTHWTNLGAAQSALAFAAALRPETAPVFDPAQLSVLEMVPERGSLSRIAEATCGTAPAPELSPLFDYSPHLAQTAGLLGDAPVADGQTVLLGTSYSNRYGRDSYQSADALAAALQRPVENRSVSGGGMIGPFETYLLTGGYEANRPDLIIWEFPYTYQLTEAALRQVLGALRAPSKDPAPATVALTDGEAVLEIPAHQSGTDLLGLRLPGARVRDIILRAHLADGSSTRLRLRRKSRMDEVALLDTWWVDLRGFAAPLASVSIELRGAAEIEQVEALLGVGSG